MDRGGRRRDPVRRGSGVGAASQRGADGFGFGPGNPDRIEPRPLRPFRRIGGGDRRQRRFAGVPPFPRRSGAVQPTGRREPVHRHAGKRARRAPSPAGGEPRGDGSPRARPPGRVGDGVHPPFPRAGRGGRGPVPSGEQARRRGGRPGSIHPDARRGRRPHGMRARGRRQHLGLRQGIGPRSDPGRHRRIPSVPGQPSALGNDRIGPSSARGGKGRSVPLHGRGRGDWELWTRRNWFRLSV